MRRCFAMILALGLPSQALAQKAPQPIGPNGLPSAIGSGVIWTPDMWRAAFQGYVSTQGGHATNAVLDTPVLKSAALDQASTQAGDGVYAPASVTAANLLRAIRVTPQMFLGPVSDGSVTDWTPYFQAAIDFVEAHGGGAVYVPARYAPYPFLGVLSVNTSGTVITGDGRSSNLMINAVAGDFITFTGCMQCGVQHVTISGNVSYNSVLRSGGEPFAVTLGVGTNSAFVRDVLMQFVWNGVHISQSNGEDQVTEHVNLSNLIGHYGVLFDGSTTNSSYRATIENLIGGNVPSIPYHVNPSTGVAWKTGTSYSKGDTVQSSDGGIWVAATAGTSGTQAPSGVPGSGATTFSVKVSDGGVSWIYASGNLSWVVQDSYSYSLVVRSAALLGGAHAVVVRDQANTGYSHPKWLFGWDIEGDHNLFVSWDILAGEAAKCDTCWFDSLAGYGAEYAATTTEGSITNSRLAYSGGGGIHVDGGVNFTFSSNHIGQNCGTATAQSDTTCAGIWIGNGTRGLTATANVIGALGNPVQSVNPQAYGIYYQPGSSTTGTAVTGNVLFGNNVGSLFNTNTGPYNTAIGNSSDN